MIPELGQLALSLALAVALALSILPLWGAHRQRLEWMLLARPLARCLSVLVLLAFAALASSFIRNDFSVLYVAENSNSALPLAYRIAGVWGGHEGSLLLWVSMLSLWMLAVAQWSRHLPQVLVARILAVMGMIAVGFLLFMLLTSDPFARLLPMAADGQDLNPLLQDPGMVSHPPMLYMGYVGFSVAFAFAVAALLGGELDATWARWTRPWTLAAWAFLTVGIMLGSIWAYYELGWGGWWFWDPVENASFMPWLAGTALVHSLAVSEKRNSFKSWTVLLAIIAFSLSLLGTFLVRSGVLSSVHAFASDPARGLFILCFLVLVVGSSLSLYAWRAPSIGLGQRFAVVSKESMLLINNVLLMVAAASVLLGTLYPLFMDALGLGKISVGPPYFNAVFVPVMTPLIFLLGVGPMARWREAAMPDLMTRLRWAFALSLLSAGVSGWLSGRWSSETTLGIWMCSWIAITTLLDLANKVGWDKHPVASWPQRLSSLPRAQVGMMLAHLGVAAFCLGVSMVKAFEVEQDVKMAIGQTASVGRHAFRLDGLQQIEGPNYSATQANISVTQDGELVTVLHPQKRVYRVQTNPMTEAAIRPSLQGDIYVSMGEALEDGSWVIRLYDKPFVDWIWGGCALMALGGAVAACDKRYRHKTASKLAGAGAGVVAAIRQTIAEQGA